jgi:hypothetical protein
LDTGGNTGGGVAPRLAVSTLPEGLLLGIDMILPEGEHGSSPVVSTLTRFQASTRLSLCKGRD